jgi:hypothetical protein
MGDIDLSVTFEPERFRAYFKNEAEMKLKFSNPGKGTFWCECEINVVSPLSLAHDKELDAARTKVGILKPGSSIEKRIKLYTRPNNFPDDYKVKLTSFFYDEDGAISERTESEASIKCEEAKNGEVQV